jgi:hypothetical protein
LHFLGILFLPVKATITHIIFISAKMPSPGVGKVRPTGQNRPAKTFCLARSVVSQPMLNVFYIKMKIFVLVFGWPEVPQKFFLMACGLKKNCPPLA